MAYDLAQFSACTRLNSRHQNESAGGMSLFKSRDALKFGDYLNCNGTIETLTSVRKYVDYFQLLQDTPSTSFDSTADCGVMIDRSQ